MNAHSRVDEARRIAVQWKGGKVGDKDAIAIFGAGLIEDLCDEILRLGVEVENVQHRGRQQMSNRRLRPLPSLDRRLRECIEHGNELAEDDCDPQIYVLAEEAAGCLEEVRLWASEIHDDPPNPDDPYEVLAGQVRRILFTYESGGEL